MFFYVSHHVIWLGHVLNVLKLGYAGFTKMGSSVTKLKKSQSGKFQKISPWKAYFEKSHERYRVMVTPNIPRKIMHPRGIFRVTSGWWGRCDFVKLKFVAKS